MTKPDAPDEAQTNAAGQAPCYSESDQPATAHKARATPAIIAGEDDVDADHRVPTQPVPAAPDAPTLRTDDALHASAPKGYKCANCQMDAEPCPVCYQVWWQKRHPDTNIVCADDSELAAANAGIAELTRLNKIFTDEYAKKCYELIDVNAKLAEFEQDPSGYRYLTPHGYVVTKTVTNGFSEPLYARKGAKHGN